MRPRRALFAAGVAVGAAALFVAWYAFGAWPVPDGYSFPRHSMFGGPTALYVGTLEDVDGCIRATGDESFAVVWPPGYRLSVEDGEPSIHGGSGAVGMGEPIRMGGGYYEDGAPPPETRDVGDCDPPFFLSTGINESSTPRVETGMAVGYTPPTAGEHHAPVEFVGRLSRW